MESYNATSAAWDAAWDATLESSAAARIKGVRSLCGLLQMHYDPDYMLKMEQRFIDIASSALSSTRRPDKALESAVANMLSVFFLQLGDRAGHAYTSVVPQLTDRARNGKSGAACATALACGAVATSITDHEKLASMRNIAGIWLVSKGNDLEAAIRAWSFVMTTLDVRTISAPLIETLLEHLSSYLSGRHVGVRNASAEAIGLLYSMCGLEVRWQEPELETNSTEHIGVSMSDDASSVSHMTTCSWHSVDTSRCSVGEEACDTLMASFDDIMNRLEALSKNRGDDTKRSKTDRRESRRSALTALKTMQSGGNIGSQCRTAHVRCRNQKIALDHISQQVAHRALANVFQSGLEKQLRYNPLLAALLSPPESEFTFRDETFSCMHSNADDQFWRSADKTARVGEKAMKKASAQRMAAHMMYED